MVSQLQYMKRDIEDGDSVIETFESLDLELMAKQGDAIVAEKIAMILKLTGEVLEAADVDGFGDNEPDDDSSFADGEAFASMGWGTDEDYGGNEMIGDDF